MTNTKINTELENYWRGYLWIWNNAVPEVEGLQFRRHWKTLYNIPTMIGETVPDVGPIFNIQKDDIGMFVLVRHGGTRTDGEELEWTYTLKEPPTVVYQMDPLTGQQEKVLAKYLIQSIGVRQAQKEQNYGSPTVVVESSRRPQRKSAGRNSG